VFEYMCCSSDVSLQDLSAFWSSKIFSDFNNFIIISLDYPDVFVNGCTNIYLCISLIQ